MLLPAHFFDSGNIIIIGICISVYACIRGYIHEDASFLQVIGVSYLFFIITQNGGIFKVKNVLKIEKNEYFNYDKEEKCI